MEIALKEARLAAERGEVPVGAAVISPQGAVLARAGNQMRAQNDPSAHAEVLAIRSACKALGSERLSGCDLYVSLEPCPMCAGLIAAARIERLYYGACDPKSGGVAQGPHREMECRVNWCVSQRLQCLFYFQGAYGGHGCLYFCSGHFVLLPLAGRTPRGRGQ